MARRKAKAKRPIESYDHRGEERLNNPPVGLVTPDTDRDAGSKTYEYDPCGATPPGQQGRTLEEILDAHFGDVPQEAWDRFPDDFIENMDLYLYGADKR